MADLESVTWPQARTAVGQSGYTGCVMGMLRSWLSTP